MTTMELEACRAELARAILETEDWNVLDKVRRIVLPKSKKRAKAVEEEEPVMSDEEVREGLKGYRQVRSATSPPSSTVLGA